jgi:NADPH-dependent F420 reductase
MQVGIVGGTGPLGQGLALRLADAGVDVVVGGRDGARSADLVGALVAQWPERSLAISGADNATAADADVVVVATPWDALAATVRPLAARLHGKVVVSVANALVKDGRELHAVVPPRSSMAGVVQAAAPGALVAAACQHLPAADLADLSGDLQADVLVCSDHAEATATTMELLGKIGGLRPLDAGSLGSAGPIEAFTAVLITLNIRYRAHATLRLGGIEPTPR